MRKEKSQKKNMPAEKSNMEQSVLGRICCLQVLVFMLPYLLGGFFVWSTAITTVFLLYVLGRQLQSNGRLDIRLTPMLILSLLLPVCYGLSCFWAVDHGEAPFGVIRMLPLPLFVLALQQYPAAQRQQILNAVPWSGALMTILSGIAAIIPAVSEYVLIDGRLSGFFQYPNVFAVFLLVGLLQLSRMPRGKHLCTHLILAGLLIVGLVLSGSRTVFVLAIVMGLLRIIVETNRKTRLVGGSIGIVLLLAVLAAAFLLPDTAVGRYLQISTQSSTLMGRLLYWQDAIPVILKHPAGIGYLGYYYSQGSFQTGVYSARFVHNSFLQVLLDLGWIPGIASPALIIWSLCSKKNDSSGPQEKHGKAVGKLIVLAILLHSLFDFSLEFLSMWLLLLAAIEDEAAVFETEMRGKGISAVLGILILCPTLYFGVADALAQYADSETTLRWYPNDTPALIDQLQQADTVEALQSYGNKILKLDSYVSLGHSAEARAAYSFGDVSTMISEKQLAIDCAKYSETEYRDYFDMLQVVYKMFLQQGDKNSANTCLALMQNIPEQMQQVLEQTSALGLRITDQPELSLTEEQLACLK